MGKCKLSKEVMEQALIAGKLLNHGVVYEPEGLYENLQESNGIIDAKALFKNLEYEQTRCDDDYIIYSKTLEEDGVFKEVSFSDQLESFCVTYEGAKCHESVPINMKLFLAIQKQLIELGWI